MKPFSDNLIFFDTEFSSLDPVSGEILSIGMVKMNGEELYMELEYSGEVSSWVTEHVMPLLTAPKVLREEAVRRIIEFVGEGSPYLISYIIEFDAPFLYKLTGVNDKAGNRTLPFHWIILDFASVLFTLGRDPGNFSTDGSAGLLHEFGIDMKKYRKHHALDDAKRLREAYFKLISR